MVRQGNYKKKKRTNSQQGVLAVLAISLEMKMRGILDDNMG